MSGVWDDTPEEKEVIEEAKSKRGPKIEYFKPQEGENTIRIVGSYKWYRQYWLNKVKRTVVAGPLEKCPIYNHPKKEELLQQARTLREAGKEQEAKDLFRRTFSVYNPRLTYVVNVIDRSDGKIKLWKFSRTQKENIQAISEKYGDPNQYDLIITKRKTGPEKRDVEYTIIPDRENKLLTEAEKQLQTYNLTNIFKPTSLERVQAYLEGRIPTKASSGEDDNEDAPSQSRNAAGEATTKFTDPATDSISDEELEDLNNLGDDDTPF